MRTRMPIRFGAVVVTLALSVAGGLLFSLVRLPIPWMLGPMFAMLVANNMVENRFAWPMPFRNAAMIMIGYTIGLSMTAAALRAMALQLPYMLLMAVLLLAYCAGIAYVVSRFSGTGYKTALMGSIPGGLSQIILLAEETDGIDLTSVTFTQVTRLIMIVVCMPLIVFSPILGQVKDAAASAAGSAASASWGGLFPNILVFGAVSIVCAFVGNRVKLPTAYLLGPTIGTCLLQLTGLHGPSLPVSLTQLAQLMIGTYVGLMLRPRNMPNKVKTLSLAIGSSLLLIAGALGLALLLSFLQPVSEATGLLSLAPGGMDQMSIIAHEIHANLSIVAGYQLFRALFILFFVPPLLRMVLHIQPGGAKRRGAA
ncbi:AbrB family transcriptional regulator [Paenibacillus sacheonensis]|uniref:AbrB family transcriptional regulator n=1 Tax=Paenibacillus sacheonensis TaxID=742054 RepID=A0A7X4YJW6_9BACL|nr:AbrB family transcriptional regulator [Paenibacillus sacheonensis]MBM7563906.1 membrane AbrB-like protein [Paenibacillus sacheonensis]NBC67747.1 AbrB family transcriptional regulator [Paenibacillus sacheonensis]